MDVNENEQFDFTQFLPIQITEDILMHLDILSLCSATEVSSTWYTLINNSKYIWRNLCKETLGEQDNICLKNLNEISWKEMAIQRHLMLHEKSKWIRGEFSNISTQDICNKKSNKFIFTKKDWGDILQHELER